MQRGDALRVRDHLVLDAVRVAEDRLRHLAHQVDVEALELSGERVAVAEQQRVGRDAGDEPPALLDRLHVGARRACRPVRASGSAARTTRPGCRSRVPARRWSPWSRRVGGRRPVGARPLSSHAVATSATMQRATTSATNRRARTGASTDAPHRYSRSRCEMPRHASTAAAIPRGAGARPPRTSGLARLVEVVRQVACLRGQCVRRRPLELGERLVGRAVAGRGRHRVVVLAAVVEGSHLLVLGDVLVEARRPSRPRRSPASRRSRSIAADASTRRALEPLLERRPGSAGDEREGLGALGVESRRCARWRARRSRRYGPSRASSAAPCDHATTPRRPARPRRRPRSRRAAAC